MNRPFMMTPRYLSAAAALALVFAVSELRAQERPGAAPMGPGMMSPGAMPHPGAMVPGSGPRGQGMGHRSATERIGDSRRERRRARRMAQRMDILDTDKDGKVTLGEINAEQRRLIGAADVDGDGKLSVEEFKRRGRWFIRLRTVSFFDMLDANGDGQISAKEMTDPTARWFFRHDVNKDKALDGDEFSKSSRRRGGRSHRRRR